MLDCHECRCHIAAPCNACTECPACNPCLTCDKPHDGPRDTDCTRQFGHPSRWTITKGVDLWWLSPPIGHGDPSAVSTFDAARELFIALTEKAVAHA